VSDEMLGLRLLALHNISFLATIMREARAALAAGTFESWSEEWLARYRALSLSS
jgi:queuine tRNA-ribosyltransferase